MQEVLPELDKRAYVHRYAWYSPSIDNIAGTSSALFDAKGKLTTLGKYYANYKPNLHAGKQKDKITTLITVVSFKY